MNTIPVNTTLLEKLALVQPDQWAKIQRCANRIARGLPLVEAVWIDAMLQLGYVTPYQAKQLHEGNGESLQVGSYVILNRRESLGWADCFDAFRIDDRRLVHLAVIQGVSSEAWEPLSEQLIQLRTTAVADEEERSLFLAMDEIGIDEQRGVWITSAPCEGESVSRWLVQNGRLSPDVVLAIARQMAAGLSQLELQQQTHGDLRAATVFLSPKQGVKLLLPGVRAIARPRESFAETAGPIDMYDGLSPERATDGVMPDIKSDLFAVGSLWWQMLVGRSPMPGGDGRAKLRAAARQAIEDIRCHATDVPDPLVQAITACTARNREDRPNSFQEVATMFGEPDSHSVRKFHRTLRGKYTTTLPTVSLPGVSRQAKYFGYAVVAAGILVALTALGLAANRFFNPPSQQVVVLPKPIPKKEKSEAAVVHQNVQKVEPPTQAILPKVEPSENVSHLNQPTERSPEPKTIILDSKEAVLAESLAAQLKPGVKVTSRPGQRTQVVIGGNPLEINVPGVQFENLDFVTSKPEKNDDANETQQAMLELRESEATFRGCVFRLHDDEEAFPRTVLHWSFPVTAQSSDSPTLQTELHNGRLVFEDCIFGYRTGTALHAEVHAAVAVELRNVLHAGGGPMLFLETPPKPEEPWRIEADHVTLRDSGPFWACRYTSTLSGAVRIIANNSVLDPKGTQPLLLFVGENDPGLIFRKIEWTGQGTLVKKSTPTAAWQDNAGNRTPLGDQHATIDGLIRSQVEFTSPVDNSPASSTLQTWDAPLISETPPGIDAKRLAQ